MTPNVHVILVQMRSGYNHNNGQHQSHVSHALCSPEPGLNDVWLTAWGVDSSHKNTSSTTSTRKWERKETKNINKKKKKHQPVVVTNPSPPAVCSFITRVLEMLCSSDAYFSCLLRGSADMFCVEILLVSAKITWDLESPQNGKDLSLLRGCREEQRGD